MQVNHQYASPSMCLSDGNATTLGLSPDLSRSEKVSFCGKVKNPLVFRDAMLMLRDIVTSDSRVKPKDRADYFAWLEREIDRQVLATLENSSNVADGIKAEIKEIEEERNQLHQRIKQAKIPYDKIKKEYDEFDVWKDYNKLEKKFWQFIRERDVDLWFVLDPVITVHPDQVSFEAFSIDESIYGCLSMNMDAFEMRQAPSLGTTNIDFSEKLAIEMSRFRLEEDVELSVNPDGFAIDSGVMPQHIEKKIDLPKTWIAGFNQVSSAAQLPALVIDLTPTDIYDICAFLRRFKAHKSPRYMKWMLTPQEPIKIEFQPFGYVMELQSIYQGTKPREEKVWGRQRWTVLEKLIPLVDSFTVHLLGFSMPQFVVAHMGDIQMTIGFSAWASHDWVSGTSFNILNGFIGKSAYKEVYQLLKEKRALPMNEIYQELSATPQSQVHVGVGELMRRGEGYYDLVANKMRFRQLCNEPLPDAFFKPNYMEQRVLKLLDNEDVLFKNLTTDPNLISLSLKFKLWASAQNLSEAKLMMDEDGQIHDMSCECYQFKNGSKNMSDACEHIFNLYLRAVQIIKEETSEERL